MEQWKCTDPDTNQYGMQLTFGVFIFKEDRDGKVFKTSVDLSDYSLDEVKEYISGYYDSLEELYNIYGSSSNWVIAETIFEQL